jgi:hypothetical protein
VISLLRPFAFGASLFCLAGGLTGEDSPRFLLSAPQVMKAGWNARILKHHDLNQDGLADLAYFNLDRSRIEFLYRTKDGKAPPRVRSAQPDRWEPPLEDAPYVKEYLFISEELTTFAFGDLNDDGLTDLVRGSPEDGLLVHFRTKDNKWSKPVEIETKTLKTHSQAIKVVGKSKDSPARIFLFTEEGLEILPFTKGKPLYPSKLFREDSKRANGLDLIDLDEDGHLDWLYSTPGSERSLRIRHGGPDGFGPERSFDLALGSSFNPLPTGKRGKDPVRFSAIDRLSGEAMVFSFSKEEKDEADGLAVINFDMFPQDQKRTSWVYSDFDGDGKKDVVTASSSKGEILYLSGQGAMGFSNPVPYPSLNGITSISSVRLSPKTVGLLVLSPEENLVGLSHFKCERGASKGSFSFPVPIPVKGETVDAFSADVDGDGKDEIILVVEDRSDFALQVWQVKGPKAFNLLSEIELDFRREPSGVFPCLLDGDDFVDFIVLSEREPSLILLNEGEGKFKESCKDSSIRKSVLSELVPSRLGTADLDGDGKFELLVAGKGQVRALNWSEDDLIVSQQFNATEPQGDLSVPVFLDLDGNGKTELLYYHSGGYWEALEKDAGETYRSAYKMEDEPVLPGKTAVDSSGDSHSLLIFGNSALQIMTKGGGRLELKVESRYLTDLPKIEHAAVDWGDFNHDGKLDLLCIDGRRHFLEFLAFDVKSKQWKSVLHFKVFEENLHYQGKKGSAFEPREGYVLDLNGDGRDDIVFLVHDRLLCYYQDTP